MKRILAALATVVLAALAVGAQTNDPLVSRQYHLGTVRAFEAWRAGQGDGVAVAVLDTGVDRSHPDLQARVGAGIDIVDPGTPPDDENGHGTLVAGVLAANANNGVGVAGTAPLATVIPVRVLDASGRGRSEDVAAGIRWAVDNGASVINLSLAAEPGQGGGLLDQLITSDVEGAIREADRRGVLVVAAAGNDGAREIPYARDIPALVVGATDRHDRVWEHSNRDDRTIFAPGVGIISTWTGESAYAEVDGTSYSAPIVAAGAALLRARGLSAAEARDRLIATAVPVVVGRGRVDLAAAVGADAPPPPPTPTPAPPPPPATAPPATPEATASPSPSPSVPSPSPSPSPVATEPAVVPSIALDDRAAPPEQLPTPAVAALAETGELDPAASVRAPVAIATLLLLVDLTLLAGAVALRRRT